MGQGVDSGVLPNFLIVGAMKSGTTSLAAYLRDHPQAYVPVEKELHYFTLNRARGDSWYRHQFAPGIGMRAIGEATPEYLYDRQAPARIARLVPDARLIVMLRNPVDRAYSHYWHWRRSMGETRSFEECIDDELQHSRAPGTPPPEPYLAKGRYIEQLKRLAQHFDRAQTMVILLDDLEHHPVDTFREVCRFLGIDDAAIPESVGSVHTANIYMHPVWLWRLMVKVRIGRIVNARAGAAIWRAMVRDGDPYPPLDLELRRRLTGYFAPYNEALSEWLGRDLSDWSRITAAFVPAPAPTLGGDLQRPAAA